MQVIPVFLALVGFFLIAGLAAAIIEKVGQNGVQMANILTIVVWVGGIGMVIGILSQVVNDVTTTFHVF